jgi:succinyl-diaminopimelate desuccinylase
MDYAKLEEIQLTQELVRIESSDPGTYESAVADFVFDWLSGVPGARVVRKPVLDGRENIVATLPGKVSRPNLVYVCHMDTVPVGEGWDVPPLEARLVGERIYGRGSCDMKSGLAAGMLAFRNIARMGGARARDFVFAATVDEEDTMYGAEQLITDGCVDAQSYVLDAEPTNGMIQVAHKGKTWFRLAAHGLAVHASTPQKGSDAVAAMAEVICAINRRIAALPAHDELGVCAATFGTISGGINTNIVPDTCRATVDMRLVPPTTNAQSIALVEAAIAEGTARVPGTSCEYSIIAQRPAIEKDDASFLLGRLKQAVETVTGEAAPIDFFPGYTDTAVVAAVTGNRNCMSYGPGNLALAHKPNEYVPCADIVRAVKVLTELARDILLRA